MKTKTRDERRPFRNSGVAYRPKHNKVEQHIHLAIASHLRKQYPEVVFHIDFASDADLSAHQRSLNSRLQSRHKFIDVTIFAKSRGYCGLALEVKKDNTTVILKIGPNKGKLTTDPHIREQAKTLRKLIDAGWYANFGIGEKQCLKIIDWYFEREQQELF
jgi:hypothetical protein